jgi:hypothetical protein
MARGEYRTCLICGKSKKPSGDPHHKDCWRDLCNLKRRKARQHEEGEEFDEIAYRAGRAREELEWLGDQPSWKVMESLGGEGDVMIADALIRLRRL